MTFVDNLFENKKYLYLAAIPIAIFIISLIASFFVPQSIDLKGGILIIMQTDSQVDAKAVETGLKTNFGLSEVKVTVTQGLGLNGLQVQYMQTQDIVNLEKFITDTQALSEKDVELAKTNIISYLESNSITYTNKEYESLLSLLKQDYTNKKNLKTSNLTDFLVQNYGAKADTLQIKEVAPTLGSTFYQTAIKVAVLAFILIAIVVFLFFRKLIPCAAIIASGIFDVFGGLLGMAIFGIPLSLVTIPALLMLVGYSIDTDVMLTAKLMKQKGGSVKEKTRSALKTGITMTATTVAALLVMLIISYFTNITVLYQMSVVLVSGLIVDVSSTWLMNAPILVWYVEHVNKK